MPATNTYFHLFLVRGRGSNWLASKVYLYMTCM